MLSKQAAKLTLANPQPCGESLYVSVVEAPRLDQPKCSGYGIGAAAPESKFGRRLRPTPQTGAKPGRLCCSSRRKETDILSLGRGRRAERPAINSGRRDRDEKASIETVISRFNGSITGVVVHIHTPIIRDAAAIVSRFSDLNDKRPTKPARLWWPQAPVMRYNCRAWRGFRRAR
jgi:hypothetical protein